MRIQNASIKLPWNYRELTVLRYWDVYTTKVTPAKVAEHLLKNEEPEIALRGLIEFLEGKKRESDETKASEAEGTEEVEGKGGNGTTEGEKGKHIIRILWCVASVMKVPNIKNKKAT